MTGERRVSAEFLVEPFEEGNPGSHVNAAVDRVRAAGLEVEQGPFGNTISGAATIVIPALAAALEAALAAGATRVTLNVAAE